MSHEHCKVTKIMYRGIKTRGYESKLDRQRDSNLQRKYGITLEEYKSIFKKQKGMCALCGEPLIELDGYRHPKPKRIALDHDHLTNRVRGILHSHCNFLLGFAKDDIKILEKSILYLKSTTDPRSA